MFDVEWSREVVRNAAGLDARAMSDDDLCAAVLALTEAVSSLLAVRAEMLAEADVRDVPDHQCGMTTAGWLAREGGLPRGVARREVTVARKLRTLPEVHEAWRDGRINRHHVDVLVDACNPRITDEIVARQSELVGLAAGRVFEVFRDRIRGEARLLDQDGAYDPADDDANNRLTMARTIDGILHVSGTFVGDVAETVERGISTFADDRFHQHRADAEQAPDLPVPERRQLQALGVHDALRIAVGADRQSTVAPRAEVTLVIPAGEPTGDPGPTGVRLGDGTFRTLLCDPGIYAVVVDSLGRPLDVGRRVRLATPAQRRALAGRDGGCIFPGCGAPVSWCDAHHVEHFEHGGGTDIANLCLLCRRHHGVTHRKGWRMFATDDQWFYWRAPSGQTIGSQRHGRRRDGPAPPAQQQAA